MLKPGADLKTLILENVPKDGSAIGNQALLVALQKVAPAITEGDYKAARDALIDEGELERGRGRGGSVFLVLDPQDVGQVEDEGDAEDDEDGDEDEFALEIQDVTVGVKARGAKRKKKKKTKADGPVQVVSYRFPDKRVNNPEVGMVHPENDPDQPRTVYAYDPHIDPALNFDSARSKVEKVIDDALASNDLEAMRDALAELKAMQAPYLNWAGKAERTSFEVDTVSLHVHERVDPATILANARKRLKGEKPLEIFRQADLFAAPFENLPLRQALDFYHHEKGWSNRLIAGDSLLVMNSLLQKEAMAGKVQMIYIDPPYGIKYGSNFQPFTNKRDVKDGADADLTQEPEMIKAFRDTWELGIHSYLTYLRDRIILAKDLLHESGSIFIQISDENLHIVRNLLDEIFLPDNFVSLVTFAKTTGQTAELLAGVGDYIVWYARDKEKVKYRQQLVVRGAGDEGTTQYTMAENKKNARVRRLSRQEQDDHSSLDDEIVFAPNPCTSQRPPGEFPVPYYGQNIVPKTGYWKTSSLGFERLTKCNRLLLIGQTLMYKRRFEDYPVFPVSNIWRDVFMTGFSEVKDYVVQTSHKVIERCVLMTTDPGDLVLDPTCGSGTTAYVAEKWGRRWITCDTSRVAVTLAKQRMMTASFDYYRLRYPHEGLKGGFDYQTVPHITLKSIANNPDIDTIYDTLHPAIAAALEALNGALLATPPAPFAPAQGYRKGKRINFVIGERLEEWEVPFDLPDDWPETAAWPFTAFHAERQAMQAAMDESISDHAEPETLYDKPEIDKTRLRIAGPFSVEAVPAPTVLSLDEASLPKEADASVARSGETSRQSLWRDELMKTGIRAKGGAMLKFAELEAIPGVKYLHASGSLDTGERVAVSFGPEHAAFDQKQVERAIEDAQTLVPRPKIVVFCAFTFDPEAAKDIDEMNWPGVTLLKVQMNTDLLTEDLKKARSSNQSFWLMGQPDVELRKDGDKWRIEVHGFDYFDPRSGELVSGGKSKIAMWSLDTDYDGRSLMPHQVFFPIAGAKDGWNRLKKTIRAELDEDLLEQFHGTVSLPFEAGDQRRIAVKIVDDRGIESLKIIGLE
jgi:adenine-specific DNA-methyltransferase